MTLSGTSPFARHAFLNHDVNCSVGESARLGRDRAAGREHTYPRYTTVTPSSGHYYCVVALVIPVVTREIWIVLPRGDDDFYLLVSCWLFDRSCVDMLCSKLRCSGSIKNNMNSVPFRCAANYHRCFSFFGSECLSRATTRCLSLYLHRSFCKNIYQFCPLAFMVPCVIYFKFYHDGA